MIVRRIGVPNGEIVPKTKKEIQNPQEQPKTTQTVYNISIPQPNFPQPLIQTKKEQHASGGGSHGHYEGMITWHNDYVAHEQGFNYNPSTNKATKDFGTGYVGVHDYSKQQSYMTKKEQNTSSGWFKNNNIFGSSWADLLNPNWY